MLQINFLLFIKWIYETSFFILQTFVFNHASLLSYKLDAYDLFTGCLILRFINL